jgi:hypothetical protein
MTTIRSTGIRPRLALPVIILLLVAAGCDRTAASNTSASTPSLSGNASHAGSYEIVTVTRPESVDAYHALYRTSYEICATARELVHLPPPAPMKQPPANFIEQRDTYISDGKVFFHKQENFTMTLVNGDPKAGCETRFLSSTQYWLVRDGQLTLASVSEEGRKEETHEWSTTNPYKSDLTSSYTEKKTIRGVAVRCQTPTGTALDQIAQDLCIADGSPHAPIDADDRPIPVSSRVVNPVLKDVVMLTEPVSVKLGIPIERKSFDLTGKN